ncbi:hypothetical protein HGRIS_004581 [Hohenbuehelia grisea]|uniref:NTF2 domain-containing protein n=1 Tax=Hohenbuehelia grisea TaxID=104357 RepID=A0ABR3JDJ3_9AGAR
MYQNTTFHRGRGRARGLKLANTRSEDSQPNESIHKRTFNVPPTIITSRPQPSAPYGTEFQGHADRGRTGYVRGRGSPNTFNGTQRDARPPRRYTGQPWNADVQSDCMSKGLPPKFEPSASRRGSSSTGQRIRSSAHWISSQSTSLQLPNSHDSIAASSAAAECYASSSSSSFGTSSTRPFKRCRAEAEPSHVRATYVNKRSAFPSQPRTQRSPKREISSPPLRAPTTLDDNSELVHQGHAIKTEALPKPSIGPSPYLQTPCSSTKVPKMKRESPEPAPSSPHVNSRRLVRSGCSRYAPVPPECEKLKPDFKNHRKKWAQLELAALASKGLRKTRIFFRDDGMVIEWESPVPVWSDTLLPDEPAASDHSLGPDIIDLTLDSGGEIVPPVLSGPGNCGVDSAALPTLKSLAKCDSRNPTPSPTGSNTITELLDRPAPITLSGSQRAWARTIGQGLRTDGQTAPSSDGAIIVDEAEPIQPEEGVASSDQNICSSNALAGAPENDIEDLTSLEEKYERLSVQFLQSYIRLFDSDRPALVHAYSPDALFSCTAHLAKSLAQSPASSSAERFMPTDIRRHEYRTDTIARGSDQITSALLRLGAHRLSHADLDYDTLYIPHDGSILVTCHGAAIDLDVSPTRPLAISQSFILRQNDSLDAV